MYNLPLSAESYSFINEYKMQYVMQPDLHRRTIKLFLNDKNGFRKTFLTLWQKYSQDAKEN